MRKRQRRFLVVNLLFLVLLFVALLGPLHPDFIMSWECRCDSCTVVLDRFPLTTKTAVYIETNILR